jgi:hypothetical protein
MIWALLFNGVLQLIPDNNCEKGLLDGDWILTCDRVASRAEGTE